jgi:hypothetical protein
MSCNNNIDNRGARVDIFQTDDTVFDKTFTFTDSNDEPLDLSGYNNWVFRINTDTVTEFTESAGDITVNDNVLSCNFNIDLELGSYEYQLIGITAIGEKEFIQGKLKIS